MMTVTYHVENGLYVNITNRCTNSCDFCIRNNKDGAYGSDSLWLDREPTEDEIFDAILKEDPNRFKEIVFCGYGEPTCRLDVLLAVCRRLREVTDTPIRLNTNGHASLIAGEDVAPRFKGCFDTVSISLNEATAEKYQAVCHSCFGEDGFYGMLDFAERVADCVPFVMMSVVRQFLSEEDLAVCQKMCAEIGVSLKVREYIAD